MSNLKFRARRVAGLSFAAVSFFALAAAATDAAVAAEKKAGVRTQVAVAEPLGLFGTREIRSTNVKPFKKWRRVMARYQRQRKLERKPCNSGPCPLQRWKKFLASLKGQDRRHQIAAVNRYLNEVRYIPDKRNNGKSDYWSTPKEFFARGGDCEDYAIAKYLSLRALGFDTNSMRLVILQDRSVGLAHAVLVLEHGGEMLMLDNQIKKVVAANKVRHYQPYYSINEKYWWLHKKPRRKSPTLVSRRTVS